MRQPQFFDAPHGSRIAYHQTEGEGVTLVFFGGFKSDMEGSKATALESHCAAQGYGYLRFDYSGHGQSSGKFEDGTIGQWGVDAIYAFDQLTDGPQVLVGSSMGGWLALLVARERAERVRGLVGLAAAPDFTEDLIWNVMDETQRTELMSAGQVLEPNDYAPCEPYVITKKLIEDGRRHLLLREPLNITLPVRLIQGMKDADVPWQTALQIQDVLVGDDVEIQFVKAGDHRLSEAADLERLTHTLGALLSRLETA